MNDLEIAFKKRYNRDVKIDVIENGLSKTSLKIKSDKKEFIITEHRKEGLTEYATVEVDKKLFKYKRYLDAEVHIADVLGEGGG